LVLEFAKRKRIIEVLGTICPVERDSMAKGANKPKKNVKKPKKAKLV